MSAETWWAADPFKQETEELKVGDWVINISDEDKDYRDITIGNTYQLTDLECEYISFDDDNGDNRQRDRVYYKKVLQPKRLIHFKRL